jgi:hypothetical protein
MTALMAPAWMIRKPVLLEIDPCMYRLVETYFRYAAADCRCLPHAAGLPSSTCRLRLCRLGSCSVPRTIILPRLQSVYTHFLVRNFFVQVLSSVQKSIRSKLKVPHHLAWCS